METVWWIDFHEKMDVFRHTLQFEDCDTRWSTHVLNNLLKAYINPVAQELSTLFRAPHHVIFARVDHIVVRFILDGR